MKPIDYDIVIVGAGPVGLMCAYLSNICGLRAFIVDKSEGPLQAGRADALNARSLQYLTIAGLFNDIYPHGRPCHTSSVWKDGNFISRQSSWWDNLEGCLHKHFLMIGQSHIEKILDRRLHEVDQAIKRNCKVTDLNVTDAFCDTTLDNGQTIRSKYVIGADGSRSFVRQEMQIGFEIERPEITWAVIDAVIETDFPKVPEIIVFQSETSDVAWIPREGDIDRFYVRMDKKIFSHKEALDKINIAMTPHRLSFERIDWFSQFSVKESVAESFHAKHRVFLAGDACHIHSVNGGQGLNTGLADAFNLIWKIQAVETGVKTPSFLDSYELERKPVAQSVVESSGELVRATKFAEDGEHARKYVAIVKKRSGNITGMGIAYPGEGLVGKRLHDFTAHKDGRPSSLYSMLDYSRYSLIIFGNNFQPTREIPDAQQIVILDKAEHGKYWTNKAPYKNLALLVRPDGYIEECYTFEKNSDAAVSKLSSQEAHLGIGRTL